MIGTKTFTSTALHRAERGVEYLIPVVVPMTMYV